MKAAPKIYKSTKQALAWCFEKSRDLWKDKCGELRKEIKVMKVRVADSVQARDAWRAKQEDAVQRIDELKSQVAELQVEKMELERRVVELDSKKKNPVVRLSR